MADDDLPLYELRDDVFVKICKSIDSGDFNTFKSRVPTKWSGEWNSRLCSAAELLNEFRKRGVTVHELAELLNDLEFEEPMSYIVDDIPVKLVQNLPEEVVVNEGESLVLKCKASGFLFPKYQWYRCCVGSTEMTPIDDQMSSVLEISGVSAVEAGSYACRAYNFDKKGKKFTADTIMTRVTVLVESSLHVGENGDDNEEENGVPVIKFQPSAPRLIEIGSNILLQITAKGKGELKYEWYKDGQPIPDSNDCRHEILKVQPNCEQRRWTYQCRVSNFLGAVLSNPVDIVLAPHSVRTQYKAEDKVALLIGNGNYTNLHPLRSAVEDVVTLGRKLTSLGFKVIALSDMILDEMKNAVKLFCSLLDEGVYGVFYYAGHGFEKNNQRYMLPVNAISSNSVSNSLCAEYIQEEMQKKTPALVAFFLDMCRTECEMGISELNHEVFERYKPAPHPNFVIAYATTSGSRAFELQGQQNGIFAHYLKDYITQPLPIKQVVDKVIVAVNNDPFAGHVQHPCSYQGLCEAISLTDPIEMTSPNSKTREERFRSISRCPLGFVTTLAPKFPHIPINMDIQSHKLCLLNGVDIILEIMSKDASCNIVPYLKLDDEKIVTQNMEVSDLERQNVFAVSILGIQKLKKPILATICYFDRINNEIIEWKKIDLGSPQIMAAKLWELNQSAKPVEEDSWMPTAPLARPLA